VAVAGLEGPALVLGDPDPTGARALEREGLEVVRWSRRLGAPGQGTGAGPPLSRPVVAPWPPEGPFATAALRLPKAKEELAMTLHAAASVLIRGGTLLLYGANDEGARSAGRRIEPLFGSVETVMRKRRCRVLRAVRPEQIPGLKPRLEAWKEPFAVTLGGEARRWASYPGVFAHGRLDRGTALLLEHLPGVGSGDRSEHEEGRPPCFLDYGCGSGMVAAALLEHHPGAEVHLLDTDAVALEAARENVPGGRTILGRSLEAAPGPYDGVVTNPPYHQGKAGTSAVLEAVVKGAPDALRRRGSLTLVVQGRLGVERMMVRSFRRVERLAAEAPYEVWRGMP